MIFAAPGGVFLARRLVGATLGETVFGVRYLPRRRLAGEAS